MLQQMVARSNLTLAGSRTGSAARDRVRVPVAVQARKRGPAACELDALSSFELAERLVQVWIRSDQQLKTLNDLNEKLTAVRGYLASANPNAALGGAYLERLRDRRARCLARLHCERRSALALMGECDARAAGGRRRGREA
jgi:hypothetical protein